MTMWVREDLHRKARKQGYEAGVADRVIHAADWEPEFRKSYPTGYEEGRKTWVEIDPMDGSPPFMFNEETNERKEIYNEEPDSEERVEG